MPLSLSLLWQLLKTLRFKSLIFEEFDWLEKDMHVTTRSPSPSLASVRVALIMYSRLNLVFGLQPRIVFASRHAFSRSPHRLISNSTCSHAEHASGSVPLTSGINERTGHTPSHAREYDAHGNELNPYRNGPSALDKAVHLFFFTEIIRGMCRLVDTSK